MFRQQPGAGAGDAAVDRRQQASGMLARKGLGQFEIASCRRVDRHEGARGDVTRRLQGGQLALLGQIDVIDEDARRRDLRPAEGAEGVERLDAQHRLETPARVLAVEARIGQGRQAALPIGEQLEEFAALLQFLRQQDFARRQPCQRRRDVGGRQRLGGEFAGREIEPAQRQIALALGQRGEKVVSSCIEQRLLGQRARRHDAHDAALHRRLAGTLLRLGRVLHLLANGDAESRADQLRQIGLGRVHRHAAHRDVLALVLAALGERDVERARSEGRVLEEQLVEIAHPVKEQAIGMLALDRKVLRHHRRRLRHRGRGRQGGQWVLARGRAHGREG